MPIRGEIDYGDSFIRINPAGSVQDYFTPAIQGSLDTNNKDLGAGGLLLLPDQPGAPSHEMLTSGKGGVLYVVDRDNLTHYNPGGDQNIQSIALGKANFSAPVYFNGRVYISPVSTNIQAYQLTNGLLSASPTSISSSIYDRRGGTLAISANGSNNGILWALQSNNDAASTLHANDAGNLANELYNSD